MYRFLQNHGKKLMAVFSAILMIAFALPSFRSGGMTGNAGRVHGTIAGEKLLEQDVYRARETWHALTQLPVGDGHSAAEVLGPVAVSQINRKPVLFLLLQKEAQKMGVSVSQDQLMGMMENTPGLKTGNPARDEDNAIALAQLWTVRQAFTRAAGALKVSSPMRDHELGRFGQSITLSAAEFTTGEYTSKVPAPTADQLKAQFDKYAGMIKGTPYNENLFGFGYKYPDRMKLQYIAVPRPAVRKSVEDFSSPGKPKDPYEWEVDAQKYYRQHQTEFPTTRQAEAPKNNAFSLETPGKKPTTKPFSEVHDGIRKKLIDEATDKRMVQIQDRIVSTMAADWTAYHNAAGSTTKPAVPASSLGVHYDSLEYLQKLAAQIQSGYGVLPTIKSVADSWQTAEDIAKLPGFAQAAVIGDRPIPASSYLIGFAAPFLPAEARGESAVLQVMQPSRPMEDLDSTLYLARITDAEAAHKPATLAEVDKQVTADVIAESAYDLAKADANKLLDQARKSSLKDAAAGKNLLTVGPLTMQSRGRPIVGLTVSPQLVPDFLTQAFKLISTPASRPSGKPVELIDLHPDGRVIVAELADVQAMWNERSRPMEEAQMGMMLKGEMDNAFSSDWYNYDSVTARLNYVPDPSNKEQESSAPAEPAAPIF